VSGTAALLCLRRKALEMSFYRVLSITAGGLVWLALLCCDGPGPGSSGAIIDTLPSGLRVVTNVPPWLDGSTRGLIQATEELRLGTALSGGPGEFGALSGLEVDGEGRIYVSDAFNTEIRVFHPDGAFSHTFGKRGEGPGELGLPHGILLDHQGRLWVRDLRNMRFSLFGRDGTFLEVRAIRHLTVAGPWRGGFDRSGRLVDWDVLRPYIIQRDGTVIWDERARSRTEVTFWPLRFREDGSLLDTLPPLRFDMPMPGSRSQDQMASLELAIDRWGFVWFSVRDQYQVWRRTLTGDTVLAFSFPAEARTDPARSDRLLRIVERILTDEAGRVYLLPQVRDAAEPGMVLDAFDSTGVFLARVNLPVKVQPQPLLVRGGASTALRGTAWTCPTW